MPHKIVDTKTLLILGITYVCLEKYVIHRFTITGLKKQSFWGFDVGLKLN